MRHVLSNSRWLRAGMAAVVAVMALFGATGSGPTYLDQTDWGRRPINYGTLVNKEVSIKAVDSSFTLKGGEQFRTPFSVDIWNASFDEAKLANQYQMARSVGAKPVMVYVDGFDQPLYGLLILNSAVNAAYGPGSQSYYVRISKDKLDNARYGGISVAYEKMDYTYNYWQEGYGNQKEERTWFGWMLWLSATPI